MTLLALKYENLDLILAWRNAPNVRKNMYTAHMISREEHFAWFEKTKSDEGAQWFVYHEEDGEPAGVVCFKEIDYANRSTSWGFYASGNARPGVGTRMEYDALEYIFQECEFQKLRCEVFSTNAKVISLHEKFGFSIKEILRAFHFDGEKSIDVVKMEILADEWKSKREMMRLWMNARTEQAKRKDLKCVQ